MTHDITRDWDRQRDDAENLSAQLEVSLYEALVGNDPEMPKYLRPIEWLRSLLDYLDTPHMKAAIASEPDDPDATYDAIHAVREMYRKCAAIIESNETGDA